MRRILPILLALALLVGCKGGADPVKPVKAETKTGSVELPPAQRTADMETAYAGFALDLLRAGREEGENTLMSPLSVTLALGMTSAGAAGDTAEQFAALFGADRDAVSAYCRALMEEYSNLGGSTEANLVNSLWCDPELELKDSFIHTCQDYFDAQLFHADLQSAETVKAVNDWVSEATKGLIPSVVDDFDQEAALALINAVYLKNRFQRPFETPMWEWTMDFHNADGTVSQPQGMSNGERTELYLSHADGQGVVMPYDDGKLGLLLMLPNEGMTLTEYLSGWDGETVSGLLEGQTEARVALQVPKFKAEWSGELKTPLSALGLVDAFDPEKADFTPMGACADGRPLFMGSVIHKTAFEVNEKGTEAAAVTAVVMEANSAMPPDDLIILRFDRPFVYGIVDLERGTPLFLGTLEQL